MTTHKIDSKITAFRVVTPEESKPANHAIIQPVPTVKKRPQVLNGSTYKISSPLADQSLYVTINDIEVETATGTSRQPFEIFINSKDMGSFQWITALTRMISANFRKGGDVTFIIEELESIIDPASGGYIARGGLHIGSLVAEIGGVIRTHFETIGLIKTKELDQDEVQYLQEKKESYLAKTEDRVDNNGFPDSAVVCPSCRHKSMISMDNCMTCLNCGNSKCG